VPCAPRAEHRVLTETFIAACAGGDIDGLLHILDPEVTGTIDTFAQLVVTGASRVAPNLLRYWSGPDHTLVSYPVGSQPARSARR
jgi:RNA polymerase sigma-70 factor (ECF subfamily)